MSFSQWDTLLKELIPVVISVLALWRGHRNKARLVALEKNCLYPHEICKKRIEAEAKGKVPNGEIRRSAVS